MTSGMFRVYVAGMLLIFVAGIICTATATSTLFLAAGLLLIIVGAAGLSSGIMSSMDIDAN